MLWINLTNIPLVGRFVLAADSASQPLRRNQPASQTATAAESASQPPCCGGISQPAKESTSAQSHLMLVNSDHSCAAAGGISRARRTAESATDPRRTAESATGHRSAADGGISHRTAAAGGISRVRRTAESATDPRRLAEIISAPEMPHL